MTAQQETTQPEVVAQENSFAAAAQAAQNQPAQVQAQQVQAQSDPHNKVEELSFDDDVIIAGDLDKFPKMAKDQVTRFCFLVTNEKGSPKALMSQTFYSNDSKKLFQASENTELNKQCTEKFGTIKARFVTLVGVYDTDRFGAVVNPANPTGAVYALVMNAEKFKAIKAVKRAWTLHDRDLNAQCSDENYQSITFNPCPEMAFQGEALATLKEHANALWEQEVAKKFLGANLNDQEIVNLLNQGGVAPASMTPMAGGMMPAIGGAPAPQMFGDQVVQK